MNEVEVRLGLFSCRKIAPNCLSKKIETISREAKTFCHERRVFLKIGLHR